MPLILGGVVGHAKGDVAAGAIYEGVKKLGNVMVRKYSIHFVNRPSSMA